MKLGSLRLNGKETVVARLDDATGVALEAATMQELIGAGQRGLDAAASAIDGAVTGALPTIELANADWLPPNPRATKVVGCALNNENVNRIAHRAVASPIFFMKARSAMTGHGKPIRIRARHGFTVPEPEPAVVLRDTIRDANEDTVLDHVFGYTVINDCTANGIKFGEDAVALNQDPSRIHEHQMAWRHRFDDDNYVFVIFNARSKSADSFAPMGPWITTADEVPDPDQLRIRGYVDGVNYTDDSTSSYLFSVARVIAEASAWFTLEAGDCVATGTGGRGTDAFPGGPPSVDLRQYAVTDVDVSGLCRLSNPIDAELA